MPRKIVFREVVVTVGIQINAPQGGGKINNVYLKYIACLEQNIFRLWCLSEVYLISRYTFFCVRWECFDSLFNSHFIIILCNTKCVYSYLNWSHYFYIWIWNNTCVKPSKWPRQVFARYKMSFHYRCALLGTCLPHKVKRVPLYERILEPPVIHLSEKKMQVNIDKDAEESIIVACTQTGIRFQHQRVL